MITFLTIYFLIGAIFAFVVVRRSTKGVEWEGYVTGSQHEAYIIFGLAACLVAVIWGLALVLAPFWALGRLIVGAHRHE